MGNLTRQDVQQVVDTARNLILQRVVTRQDLQTVCDSMRDRMLTYMADLQQQNVQTLRQFTYQNTQLVRRTVALEARIISLEQELRSVRQQMARVAQSSPQQIIMPILPADTKDQPGQYVYRPA